MVEQVQHLGKACVIRAVVDTSSGSGSSGSVSAADQSNVSVVVRSRRDRSGKTRSSPACDFSSRVQSGAL
jgi:hypothetical protein